MSNIYEFPQQEKRFDEASLWITRMDEGLSNAEERELCEWMAADPENQALLLEMARLWDKMSVLTRLADLFPESSTRKPRFPRNQLAVAASVLVLVFSGVWIMSTYAPFNSPDVAAVTPPVPPQTRYETAIGEQSTVSLRDGTTVVLNTNSLIEVEYTSDSRTLELVRGEIHIQVAEDKARPLMAIANGNVVQAVGTAFSLEITNDQEVELVVTEGKVLVGVRRAKNLAVARTPQRVLPPSSVAVAAGEEIVLGAPVLDIVEVSPEEIEVKLSWRQGNLVFRGESLEEAVAEIGRYTTVEFVIVDEDLKKRRIGGLFKAGDVEGLLAALRSNFSISYERIEDDKILLTSL